MKHRFSLLSLVIVLGCFSATSPAKGEVSDTEQYAINVLKDEETLREELMEKADAYRQLMVPMSDGVRLSTDVYLPKERNGKVPVIFWRTPYDYDPLAKRHLTFMHAFIDRGYAVVLQNERGKFFSEGEYSILGNPQTDGVDSLDWIAEQEWSVGRIGLYGCSSAGEWQLAASSMNHPALAAIAPLAAGAGIGKVGPYYEMGNWYRGGVQQPLFLAWLFNYVQPDLRPEFFGRLTTEQRIKLADTYDLSPVVPEIDWAQQLKTLPLSNVLKEAGMDYVTGQHLLSRTPVSHEWREGGLFFDDTMQINTPALWGVSWMDVSSAPNIALYNHARSNPDETISKSQYMIIGPNLHCAFTPDRIKEVGDRTFEDAPFAYIDILMNFYDRYVKGDANRFEREQPRVRYFDMGEEAWKTTKDWPPKGVQAVGLTIDSGGSANSLFGDGVLEFSASASAAEDTAGSDTYMYDPMNPTPTNGGGFCCLGDNVPPGIFDQRGVEARADVLVYTSPPLERDLEVAGPVDITVYVSSDAPDTDFMFKLVDVFPDGTAYNVDDTAQRARWREGYVEGPVFMEPGVVYVLRIPPMVVANTFKAGHRIRLEISSSNAPRMARNLNTGGEVSQEAVPRISRNTIHHSEDYPSMMVLTVVK